MTTIRHTNLTIESFAGFVKKLTVTVINIRRWSNSINYNNIYDYY